MELVEGEDVKGPLSLATALDYARQIALTLEAAHEKGIIPGTLIGATICLTHQPSARACAGSSRPVFDTPLRAAVFLLSALP